MAARTNATVDCKHRQQQQRQPWMCNQEKTRVQMSHCLLLLRGWTTMISSDIIPVLGAKHVCTAMLTGAGLDGMLEVT